MTQQYTPIDDCLDETPRKGPLSWKTGIGYLIAAASLVWVFHNVRFGELFREVRLMNWWLVALAVGADMLNQLPPA